MKDAESDDLELTPELVLRAYAAGVFPMADNAEAEDLYWVDPRKRGILPLNGFHLSRSLKKRLMRYDYRVRIDTAFDLVLDCCADRPETWINATIRDLFQSLHRMGYAHSIEVWQGPDLIGGLFSRLHPSSKFSKVVVLVTLVVTPRIARLVFLFTL